MEAILTLAIMLLVALGVVQLCRLLKPKRKPATKRFRARHSALLLIVPSWLLHGCAGHQGNNGSAGDWIVSGLMVVVIVGASVASIWMVQNWGNGLGE